MMQNLINRAHVAKKKSILLFALLTLSAGLWAETIDGVKYIDANGVEQTANGVTEITSSSSQVTWGATDQTTWYVVTDTDVQLAQGAICNGAVNLILADGAKLTSTGIVGNSPNPGTPGIQVSGTGKSLAIYGQTAQTGQLVAIGGSNAAGIGGGTSSYGSNITILAGTVTANGGVSADGIGSGQKGSSSSNIKVATTLQVRADGSNPPTTEIASSRTTQNNIAKDLSGKRYVLITSLQPIKTAAIAAIDDAIESVTNEDIIAIATAAKTNINAATSETNINAIKEQALADIEFAIKIYNAAKAELLGSLAEPCNGCPTIEITGEETTMKLYNPKSVKFDKTQAAEE